MIVIVVAGEAPEVIINIESSSSGLLHTCLEWFDHRVGRITASTTFVFCTQVLNTIHILDQANLQYTVQPSEKYSCFEMGQEQ